MTEAYILGLGQRALVTYLQLAGPILLFSLTVGLLVSILQAVTQIQDMTLTFIPKIAATILAVVVFGQFMLHAIVKLTYNILINLPSLAT
ncbi:MAG: flagellar biosynthesis protein FliQ [Candidatus Omnitrophica bacterium]|nr:flagellar biosynthesis protein FliQ [Candidatus Omnitrophota bacterium]MBD3269147.1 flagellar biosynthesis protein FliQ [Candidatus Omnitrophota bacterium]